MEDRKEVHLERRGSAEELGRAEEWETIIRGKESIFNKRKNECVKVILSVNVTLRINDC